MTETYYDVLGVQKSADQDDIEAAWKRLVKEKHPDQNDDPNAAQQFLRLKEAYDVLGDPETRARYDRLGHDRFVRDDGAPGEQHEQAGYASAREQTRAGAAGSQSSTASTDEHYDWRAHTRGHDAADAVWSDDGDATAGPADAAGAGSQSTTDRVTRWVTFGVIAVVGFFASVYLTGAILGVVGATSTPVPLAYSVGSAVVLVGSVIGAEHLLDTDPRLVDFGDLG